MSAARNATYGYGSPAFIKVLTEWRKANDLAGLDVKYNSKDGEQPATNGVSVAETTAQTEKAVQTQATPEEEFQKPKREERPLLQQYSDLQAKHQAELNDLLRKHRGEVERLLAKQAKGHAKKDSGVEGVNGVH
jgi:cyclohexanone monooxygenase